MKKTGKRGPTERLAILVREAYVAAWASTNQHHDAPEWDELKRLNGAGPYLAVAANLMRAGVLPPLEKAGTP